jgi:hypothetical protein
MNKNELLLKFVRIINKIILATKNERIHTERAVKSKYVYNYIEVKQ